MMKVLKEDVQAIASYIIQHPHVKVIVGLINIDIMYAIDS